eukprot:TRINITY_DN76399_c0_g1_i1.p1 TRINITY_DN76399_c0_g1~~TRINITY_DN76399_c0_g1_i1.p1  ORF type:complete len:261 (+),score=35.76 TRINITY_DN76399_c0_g1_i1:40-783(+)
MASRTGAEQGDVPLPPIEEGSGLWLGDESLASNTTAMATLGITHRLQCNMSESDSQRWMSEMWDCDCPGCPASLARIAKRMQFLDDEEIVPSDALPVQLELRVTENNGVAGVPTHGYLPLFDDEPFARSYARGMLQTAAQFIHDALDHCNGRIYVHCEKGCSRSVSVVCQYLMEYRDMTLLEAASMIKSCRSRASPNGGFLDALSSNEAALGRTSSDKSEVLRAFRKPWIADFKAGRIRPRPVDRIL